MSKKSPAKHVSIADVTLLAGCILRNTASSAGRKAVHTGQAAIRTAALEENLKRCTFCTRDNAKEQGSCISLGHAPATNLRWSRIPDGFVYACRCTFHLALAASTSLRQANVGRWARPRIFHASKYRLEHMN
eukprot:1136586-Pelagomonas_calceolata.AAC.2